MNIRRLAPSDAPAFRASRLAALLDTPEAFAVSHVEEENLPLAWFEERLAERAGQAVFGAFDGDTLVGILGLARGSLLQAAHKGEVWGMYVAPAARGRGVAGRLMQAALAHARATPGIAKVTLSADAANLPALHLYESLGFVEYGREVDATRLHGESRDEVLMHLRFAGVPADTTATPSLAKRPD